MDWDHPLVFIIIVGGSLLLIGALFLFILNLDSKARQGAHETAYGEWYLSNPPNAQAGESCYIWHRHGTDGYILHCVKP